MVTGVNETRATVRGAAVRAGSVERAGVQLQPAGDRLDSGRRSADRADGLIKDGRQNAGDGMQVRAHGNAARPADEAVTVQRERAETEAAAAAVVERAAAKLRGREKDSDDGEVLPRRHGRKLRGHDCLTAAVQDRQTLTDWFPARAATGLRLWMAVFATWLCSAIVHGFAAGEVAWGVTATAVAVAVLWANYPGSATTQGAEPQVQGGQQSDTGDPEVVAAMPKSGKQGRKSRSKKVQREELVRGRWSKVLEMLVEQGFAGRAAKWKHECDKLQVQVKELEEKLQAEINQHAGDAIAHTRRREECERLHAQEVLRLKHTWSAQLAQVRREAIEVALEQVQSELTKLPHGAKEQWSVKDLQRP